MAPKVSVILPVYNVAAYLEECLDSILSQDLNDIEIICVNDGSTDTSLEILQHYASKDSRIILFNKENNGVGSARNTGLQQAKGEYIFISDSDDYLLKPTALFLLYTTASEQNLDILSFDFTLVGEIESEYRSKSKANIISDGKEFLIQSDNIVMVWNKLYKRSYLDSIHFLYAEIIYEDDESLPRLYINASRVMHLDTLLYAYRQRSNSIMRQKISLKHFHGLAAVIASYNTLFQKESHSGFRKYLKKRLYDYLFRFYYLSLNYREFPETAQIYNEIKRNLSLSKLDLFFIHNDEKFIVSTQIKNENKFAHPMIYTFRKLRKIFF
ncbi:MAG: glycosyltransferase [Sulfuricurvum sp.]|uniref:glycosyltransferase family 2 protein n=1 Tax=Sulfuricurvum sp. TaxID=2025608 RepID=UPI0026349738|nr:glycosyltransferase [Sulfuricurvum sp.]MDD2367951.1 glycosyltransferase [Sulfuricurvum sp.]MDD2951433.1 glycosyltransferase [Sulfuricurvum sp.]MDD5117469.1 glycosyltransferase [Sulfuricurvum sp.]